jgi:hypothetical protein
MVESSPNMFSQGRSLPGKSLNHFSKEIFEPVVQTCGFATEPRAGARRFSEIFLRNNMDFNFSMDSVS